MAATQSFLKDSLLNSKNPKPGVVKVVRHVAGPLEDGTLIREVADSTVYIIAIFTKDCQDLLQQNYDSFNSQPDWKQGLLLLNRYHVEFQSSFHPDNGDRRPRFVLVIEKFSIFNTHQGFYSKNQPKDVMNDHEVRAKALEMERSQAQSALGSQSTQDKCPGSQCGEDVSLSMLLEKIGESSLPDTACSQNVQSKEQENNPHQVNDSTSEDEEVSPQRHTLQSALDAMRTLNVEDFFVSTTEQAILDAIPEWKADYVAPAPQSFPEHLDSMSSGMVSSDPPELAQHEPTLRSERDGAFHPGPPSPWMQSQGPPVARRKKTGLSTDVSPKPSQEPEGNLETPHNTEQEPQKRQYSSADNDVPEATADKAMSEKDAPLEPCQASQDRTTAPRMPSADSSEASGSSGDSHIHPDVRFSYSSPSLEEDSSFHDLSSHQSADVYHLHPCKKRGELSLQASQAEGDQRAKKQSKMVAHNKQHQTTGNGDTGQYSLQLSEAGGSREEGKSHRQQRSTGVCFNSQQSPDLSSDSQPGCTLEFSMQASLGFSPSEILTQDIIPDEKDSSIGFEPEDLGIQELVPDESFTVSCKTTTRGKQQKKTSFLSLASCRQSAQQHQSSDDQQGINSNSKDTVYYSTQRQTSGDSPSASLCLNFSPIEDLASHRNKKLSVTVMDLDEEERVRLMALETDDANIELPQTRRPKVSCQPGKTPKQGKSSITVSSSVVTALPESSPGSSQETSDSMNTSRVLVGDSGSDDSFDEGLLHQASGQGLNKAKGSAGEPVISSSETVVVPDSIQEEILILSSSDSSSLSEMSSFSDRQPETEALTVGELFALSRKTYKDQRQHAPSSSGNALADRQRQKNKNHSHQEPAASTHKSRIGDKNDSHEISDTRPASKVLSRQSCGNPNPCQAVQHQKRTCVSDREKYPGAGNMDLGEDTLMQGQVTGGVGRSGTAMSHKQSKSQQQHVSSLESDNTEEEFESPARKRTGGTKRLGSPNTAESNEKSSKQRRVLPEAPRRNPGSSSKSQHVSVRPSSAVERTGRTPALDGWLHSKPASVVTTKIRRQQEIRLEEPAHSRDKTTPVNQGEVIRSAADSVRQHTKSYDSVTNERTSQVPKNTAVSTAEINRTHRKERDMDSPGPTSSAMPRDKQTRIQFPTTSGLRAANPETAGCCVIAREQLITRKHMSDSVMEKEADSESESPYERIQRDLPVWFQFRARTDDPKQRRLNLLKLEGEILEKVEECLRQPCT